jgi:hypothetical protein
MKGYVSTEMLFITLLINVVDKERSNILLNYFR